MFTFYTFEAVAATEWSASIDQIGNGYFSRPMRDSYSSDDFPFTVEDWTNRDKLEVIAVCQNATMAIGAWEAEVKERPGRKLVARWGRGWTMRRSWEGD